MKCKTRYLAGVLATAVASLFFISSATGATVDPEATEVNTAEESDDAWDTAKKSSNMAWEKTKEASRDVWNATKETSSDAWGATKEFSSDAWDATKEGSSSAWNATREWVSGSDEDDTRTDENNAGASESDTDETNTIH
ncbi:MAG: hypothetical protein LJE75_07075 [Gammaproteobacteria bacterium]|jgi:phage-related minor tail protein|nr:hypothetical protein [Gammaproteobacteria bacterium]